MAGIILAQAIRLTQDYDYMVSGSSKPSQYSQHDAYLDKDYSGGGVTLNDGYSAEINTGRWFFPPGSFLCLHPQKVILTEKWRLKNK